MGLIHMTKTAGAVLNRRSRARRARARTGPSSGRVQDSVTGRFLSADPYITEPGNTQNFNRYGYVYNNPLSYVDPSGFTSAKPKPVNTPTPSTPSPGGVDPNAGAPIDNITVTGSRSGGGIDNVGHFDVSKAAGDLNRGGNDSGAETSLEEVIVTGPDMPKPEPKTPNTSVQAQSQTPANPYTCGRFGMGCAPSQEMQECPKGGSPSRANNPNTGSNMTTGMVVGFDLFSIAGLVLVGSNVLGFPEVPIFEAVTTGLAYGGAYGFATGAVGGLLLTPPKCP